MNPSPFAKELAEKLSREKCSELYHDVWVRNQAALIDRELEQAVADFQELVDCCPCQNGCKPDDMSCATQRATATLRRFEKE